MTNTNTHPAVEVTLASGYANIPATTFVSYVQMTTARGNLVVADQSGYALTVSPGQVRQLGYDAEFSIAAEQLVAVAS